jgi:hypothetical protein
MAVMGSMIVSFLVLYHVVVSCSDVSEEHTVSIFRVTELVEMAIQVIKKNNCARYSSPSIVYEHALESVNYTPFGSNGCKIN